MTLTDDIRAAAGRVAGRARSVRIRADRIAPYARTLAGESPPAPDLEGATDEERAAFSLQLNAINFGSGWFATLRKPPGLSGFRTVEAGLRRRGPWTAGELRTVTREAVAAALQQDPGHVLMGHFARHLQRAGRARVGGSFLAFAQRHATAEDARRRAGRWPTWRDVSPYRGDTVPFFKRAQIAAADLALSRLGPAQDLAPPDAVRRQPRPPRAADRRRARVRPGPRRPHRRRPSCSAHDSPEEVEIRACALHAVELLVAAHGATTATAVDNMLWHRGAGARYKAHPRHRAPCTAY